MYMYLYIYLYMYSLKCIYIYVYIYIFTYIYIIYYLVRARKDVVVVVEQGRIAVEAVGGSLIVCGDGVDAPDTVGHIRLIQGGGRLLYEGGYGLITTGIE